MSQLTQQLAALPLQRRAEFLARLRSTRDGFRADTVAPRGATVTEAPLTHTQRTLWFIEQLATGQATYHLPHYFRLRGALDPDALRRALAGVVVRHAIMRTHIEERDSGPVQVVAATIAVDLPVVTVDCEDGVDPVEEALRRATRDVSVPPFALDQAPLWRARLYRLAPDDHVLVFVIHHVIFDGASVEIFYAELAEHYRAEIAGDTPDVPDLPVQYTDFALWQHERLTGDRLDELTSYWRNQLGGVPNLELPLDRPRPAQVTFRGGAIDRELRPGLGRTVLEFARSANTTGYVVYLAAFWTLLHRLSGQDDVVVGASTTGRHRPELANLLGFFVNVIGLRGRLAPRATFRQIVMEADRVLRDALAHSDVSFEQIVQAVRPPRDLSRSPIFQVSLLVTGAGAEGEFADIRTTPLYRSHGTARFDMAWAVAGTDDVTVAVEYSTDLFDGGTVHRMIGNFEELLDSVLSAPDFPVSQIEMTLPTPTSIMPLAIDVAAV